VNLAKSVLRCTSHMQGVGRAQVGIGGCSKKNSLDALEHDVSKRQPLDAIS